MTRHLRYLLFSLILFLLSSPCSAQDDHWEREFIIALQKGKSQIIQTSGGLGYTRPENDILDDAIKRAMEQQAPPCDAMKIAVNLKYNPFNVIKSIFGYGGEIDLDQVCMCATESGVKKQIIARAASNATSPLGDSVFQRDEIAQSQCLNEMVLAYTSPFIPIPDIPPLEKPDPISVSAPGP